MGKLLIIAKRPFFCCAMVVLLLIGCGSGTAGAVAHELTLEIMASPEASGTVSPAGRITYSVGTKVEVTAVPADGYVFIGWSGAPPGIGKRVEVTVMADGYTVTNLPDTPDGKAEPVTVKMGRYQWLVAKFRVIVTTDTLTDSRDGNKYPTVKIKKLTWMAQNLNFKTDNSWCHDDDDGNCRKFGRLYDWNTALKACPAGWRLPSREDWDGFIQEAGAWYIVGVNLKSTTGWKDRKDDALCKGTDIIGFSALPGGYRYNYADSIFYSRATATAGYWWSATEYNATDAWYRSLRSYHSFIIEHNYNKNNGLSVRCVRK